MGVLQAVVIFLVLLLLWTCLAIAQDGEWKSATATFAKETQASIIVEGACGYGEIHRTSYGKYSAGLSSMLFNRGSSCGGCFEVRCVDHILWCLQGSPSVILTATDFCPPNYGLPADDGGWCNFPRAHFEMSQAAFTEIAHRKADIVPVQYKRVNCDRKGGNSIYYQWEFILLSSSDHQCWVGWRSSGSESEGNKDRVDTYGKKLGAKFGNAASSLQDSPYLSRSQPVAAKQSPPTTSLHQAGDLARHLKGSNSNILHVF